MPANTVTKKQMNGGLYYMLAWEEHLDRFFDQVGKILSEFLSVHTQIEYKLYNTRYLKSLYQTLHRLRRKQKTPQPLLST
jgi:hypothetical protein